MSVFTRYGSVPIDREDITDDWCFSVDLRSETGDCICPNETKLCPPGTFRLSVFGTLPGEHPVGEVRLIVEGREVRLVGHLTGREGVTEITPDHLEAAVRDPDGYLRQLQRYVLGAA